MTSDAGSVRRLQHFYRFLNKKTPGAILLSNFLWQPVDAGTINMGLNGYD